MSFWAATVITNLFSAIPKIGNDIVIWLWSGYSVSNATLVKFFSLHYFLPFVILGLVFVHILLLHENGSNNPLGYFLKSDCTTFFPYYFVKDLFGFVIYFYLVASLILLLPNLLGHSDNYIQANPMVTPSHIVPEWYFLPFYAILRSIPYKLGGVGAMGSSIAVLFILPWLFKAETRSMAFRPMSKFLFWIFLVSSLMLGWIGSMSASQPFVFVGQSLTVFYFAYFLVLGPGLIYLEKLFWADAPIGRVETL